MKQITPIAFICMVIGLMAWSVQDWSSPHRPLLVMFGLLMLFFTCRYTYQVFQAKETETKELLPSIPEIAVGIATLGIAALWFVVPVRQMAVPFASLQSRLNVEKALQDPADAVQVTACVQLFKIKIGKSTNRLISHMRDRPVVAEKCFRQVKAQKIGQTEFTAVKLAKIWNQKMMFEVMPQRKPICEYIKPFYHLSTEHTQIPGQAHVLSCATSSANQTTRMCCAKFINKKGNLSVAMGRVEDFPKHLSRDIYPMLSALTFKQNQLDPQNKAISEQLTVKSPATKRWVGELGCYLTKQNGPSSVDGVRGLVSFVEGDACRPESDEARLLFSKIETWDYACEVMETFPKETPIEKGMCEGMRRSLVAVAVEEAKRRVMVNARSWYLLAIAVATADNVGMYQGQKSFQARLKMWESIANNGLGYSDMSKSELMDAYGFSGGRDAPVMGALNSIPGVADFIKGQRGLNKELNRSMNFNLNSERDRDRALLTAFSVFKDSGKGKDVSKYVLSSDKYHALKAGKNKKGRMKAYETYNNAIGVKSNGVKSVGVKSTRTRSRSRSRSRSSRSRINISN